MKELQPNILNDYEHRIKRQMEEYAGVTGFPSLDDFGATQAQLDDYLFDYQAALDSEGTARAQQTLYGIIIVIPVIILSAFPSDSLPYSNTSMNLLVGIFCGLLIAALIKLIRVVVRLYRMNKLRKENPNLARFCQKVEHWEMMSK